MLSLVFAAALWAESSAEIAQNCGAPPSAEGQLTTVGIARAAAQGPVQYCEWYFTDSEAGHKSQHLRVIYTNPTGHTMVEKDLNYRYGATRPELVQRDYRNGELRITRKTQDGERWLLEYTEPGAKQPEQKLVDDAEIEVVDAGFVATIQEHWQPLLDGESLTFNFASAAHQKNLSLAIAQTEMKHCDSALADASCFRISLDNSLLRLFTSELYLLFDEQQRLIRFSGKVNILNDQNKTPSRVIDYFYP